MALLLKWNFPIQRLPVIFFLLAFSVAAHAQAPAGSRAGSAVPLASRAQIAPSDSATPVQEPSPRVYTLSPQRAAQAEDLARARRRIYFLDFAWGIVALLLILRWRVAVIFRRWAERFSQRRTLQAAVFAPLLLALLDVADLPAGVARHALALRYQLSVQPWTSWLLDLGKESILEIALGTLLVWLLYAVMRRSPRRWWFYGWLGALPILAFAVFISPWLVDPLFFTFTPLAPDHPQLAAQIETVIRRAGEEIPESHMYVMNASSKLNELNAYVTGLGASRRVVVWDTTLTHLSAPEVLSVFSHEMGHYVLGHVLDGLMFGAGLLLIGLFAGSHLFRWVVDRWGALWRLNGINDWASLPVLLLIFSVLSFFGTPLGNAYSRHIEHQADQYGLEVLHGIVPNSSGAAAGSLQILGDEDLEERSPSRAVVLWFYTHPPIRDRILFANTYDPWVPGGSPEFVK